MMDKINRWLFVLLFAASLAALPLLVMGPTAAFLRPLPLRLLALGGLALVGAGLLGGLLPGCSWGFRLAAAGLAYGTVYRLATFLPDLSTYPLSMGWSETSRFYYGSLFLGESIYGFRTAPSVLHPSRYLLQSLPFLIPGTPLWLHRLWQVALWIGLTFASAALLARRLKMGFLGQTLLVSLWAFLFLFQGPVLYHLLVPVIIVLAGYDSRRFWRSLGVILLASAWAGISRINWYPVPAMMGATLYLMERPVGSQRLWRYLAAPAIWGLAGSLTALAAQAAYVAWSGNAPEQFGSSFTSSLLWYRLLPSDTYPLGVLPAVVLVSLPPALFLLRYQRRHGHLHHPIRPLGLGAMVGVLLAGGVVVSTKIGGGSNLHNLDAYLILLGLIAGVIYAGRYQPDLPLPAAPPGAPSWLLALALIMTIGFALSNGGRLTRPDRQLAETVLSEIRQAAQSASAQGQEVLFVSERHLLTFQLVEGVPLMPDFEKVFLMEMAMAGNPNYLGALQDDLEGHRYGLVVIHPQRVRYQGRDHPFGEENDAWVRAVSEPLLCHYEPFFTDRPAGVQLLAPRPQPGNCP